MQKRLEFNYFLIELKTYTDDMDTLIEVDFCLRCHLIAKYALST